MWSLHQIPWSLRQKQHRLFSLTCTLRFLFWYCFSEKRCNCQGGSVGMEKKTQKGACTPNWTFSCLHPSSKNAPHAFSEWHLVILFQTLKEPAVLSEKVRYQKQKLSITDGKCTEEKILKWPITNCLWDGNEAVFHYTHIQNNLAA